MPDAVQLSPADYQRKTAAALAVIEATVDKWLETDVIDIDAHRTGGMLELSFPDGSVIVVNTQPPLQEMWLAARSGGYHYRWTDGAWRDTRDGTELFTALSTCASAQAAMALTFVPPVDDVPA